MTGYICKKRNIIDDSMGRGMNKFIISIAYPCLILDRMGNLEMPEGIFKNFLITAVASAILFLVIGVCAYIYCNVRGYNKEDAPVVEFAIFAPNNGFIGFPVAYTFFGDLGLLYMIACNLSLNFIFFTYGIKLMKRGREPYKKSFFKKTAEMLGLLINPKISAAFVGLLLCNMDIQIPHMINTYLSYIGGIASPMAMIFIGSTLANCRLRDTLRNNYVIEASVGKLLAAPAISVFFVCIMAGFCEMVLPQGLVHLDPLVKAVLVLGNAISVATTVPMFSEMYGRNKELASQILFMTTVASMVTIPITVWLMGKMFYV